MGSREPRPHSCRCPPAAPLPPKVSHLLHIQPQLQAHGQQQRARAWGAVHHLAHSLLSQAQGRGRALRGSSWHAGGSGPPPRPAAGSPARPPPSPQGSRLPRTPQVSGRFSTASQGLQRIRGSRAAQSWDQHRQQGGRAGGPRELVHTLPSGAGTQPGRRAAPAPPIPRLLLPPSPVVGSGPEPGHTAQRSPEHLIGLWEHQGPSAGGPHSRPRAGMGRVFTWPRPVLLDPCHVRPHAQPGLRQGQRGHRVQVTLLVP